MFYKTNIKVHLNKIRKINERTTNKHLFYRHNQSKSKVQFRTMKQTVTTQSTDIVQTIRLIMRYSIKNVNFMHV